LIISCIVVGFGVRERYLSTSSSTIFPIINNNNISQWLDRLMISAFPICYHMFLGLVVLHFDKDKSISFVDRWLLWFTLMIIDVSAHFVLAIGVVKLQYTNNNNEHELMNDFDHGVGKQSIVSRPQQQQQSSNNNNNKKMQNTTELSSDDSDSS
jgi:hypothetical protein